jgi:hypothetical protein
MRRSSRSAVLAVLIAVAGCASQAPSSAESPVKAGGDAHARRVATAGEARKIAEEAAQAAGYSAEKFKVKKVEIVKDEGSFKGMWEVSFEHVPPAPPGGHATVYVDARDGTVKLFHGK